MKPFPKFDTFAYLSGNHETSSASLDGLDTLGGLGAVILDFDNMLAGLSEAELDNYEERAAIMEFDGNLPRKEAERLACDNVILLRVKR
ncbi:MAG: hypothetical protein WCJ33_05250 [Pseudomonadota bacterium]